MAPDKGGNAARMVFHYDNLFTALQQKTLREAKKIIC
jgi:hypothetical protein